MVILVPVIVIYIADELFPKVERRRWMLSVPGHSATSTKTSSNPAEPHIKVAGVLSPGSLGTHPCLADPAPSIPKSPDQC